MTKKILIVEDNALNMKLFNDVLEANGYATILSVDGRDILEIAHQNQPDLVIMDVQLPFESGLELTKMLKADKQFEHLPVLAVTAYASLSDESELRQAGCDEYIPKPISIPDLLAAVERHLL